MRLTSQALIKSCQYYACWHSIGQSNLCDQPQSQCEWTLSTDGYIQRYDSLGAIFATIYQVHMSKSSSTHARTDMPLFLS